MLFFVLDYLEISSSGKTQLSLSIPNTYHYSPFFLDNFSANALLK
jgi:hypothetical protein